MTGTPKRLVKVCEFVDMAHPSAEELNVMLHQLNGMEVGYRKPPRLITKKGKVYIEYSWEEMHTYGEVRDGWWWLERFCGAGVKAQSQEGKRCNKHDQKRAGSVRRAVADEFHANEIKLAFARMVAKMTNEQRVRLNSCREQHCRHGGWHQRDMSWALNVQKWGERPLLAKRPPKGTHCLTPEAE